MNVDITLIDRDPSQPRQLFDQSALDELAGSIAQQGVLEPLVVARVGDRYMLIAGERRLRAAAQAGLKRVPVHLQRLTGRHKLLAQLAENVNREDMTPMEEARGYQRLIEQGMTYESIGLAMGKPAKSIEYRCDLLRLTADHQELVEQASLPIELAWYVSRLSGVGQHLIVAKWMQGAWGESKIDAGAAARAMYDAEQQPDLWGATDDPDVLERRQHARAKVEAVTKTLTRVVKACYDASLVEDADLTTGLGAESIRAREMLDHAIQQLSRLRTRVARAAAAVEVADATEDRP